jgi:preprotein translocase subunit SecG
MESLILVIHYLVCVFLIIVILLQAGKGADVGAAFGGASQTVFGSRGAATFLSKLTTAVAIIFLITSISLASISRNKGKSSILKTVPEESQPMATPVSTPAASPRPQPAGEKGATNAVPPAKEAESKPSAKNKAGGR